MREYICEQLILLYDTIASLLQKFSQKLETIVERIPLLDYFSTMHYIRKSMIERELIEELDYYRDEKLNKASKCYVIFLSPFIIFTLYGVINVFISFIFHDQIVVFFREYVKLFILVPIFLLVFVGIAPFLVFRLFFPEQEKSIKIFVYSLFIAIFFPLFVVPKAFHFYGKDVVIQTYVTDIYNKSHVLKNNTMTFSSDEKGLENMQFSRLPKEIINNSKIGEQYIITGRESKFYFTYKTIRKVD
jgi:hypothetical protein